MENVDEVAQAFGEFIRAQRRLANISQRKLAHASGMSDSYLSQVERGMYRPSAEIIKSLAEAFGLPPAMLYAQFGLLGDEPDAGATPSVEEAIRLDTALSREQKEALLLFYRALLGAS